MMTSRLTNRASIFILVITMVLALLALLSGCGGGGGGTSTGSISGRAFNASTSAGVGDAEVSAGGVQTTTASDGRFTLENVPAGSVNLVATKTSQSLVGQRTVTVTAGSRTSADVAMFETPPPPEL